RTEREAAGEEKPVSELLPRVDDRPALDQLLQLGERDQRARERDRADQRGEENRHRHVAVDAPRVGSELVELRKRDERRCAAADARDQMAPVDAVRPNRSPGERHVWNLTGTRSVTPKTPTTFAAARATATKPITRINPSWCAAPATISAPEITIPWIAFAPDISGVCSIVSTFEITSKPRKIASTRTVSSATSVAVCVIRIPRGV